MLEPAASRARVRAALRAREVEDHVGTVGWSGYVAAGEEEWLSLAVADDEERALADRCCLATFGAPLDALVSQASSPSTYEIATALQQWGVAAFPAQGSSRADLAPGGGVAEEPVSLSDALLRAGFGGSDALSRVQVVDCGQLVSAPWAAALLRAWGATATVVTHPVRASSRRYGAAPEQLDLRTAVHRHRFARLCAHADVVIDNFRASAWDSLGLDPLELGARLHLRVPAFPSDHPDRALKAYGFQIEACYAAGHVPAAVPGATVRASRQAVMDHAVGMAAAVACVRALRQGATGRLEVAQLQLIEADDR
jgi:hypothetical protein